MRKWLYKTDESGRPRRFLNHRELLVWAARKVSGFAASALGFLVAALVVDPERPGRGFTLLMAGIVLLGCAAVAFGIYLYVALSGGLMSPGERVEYLEWLRESRRGRW